QSQPSLPSSEPCALSSSSPSSHSSPSQRQRTAVITRSTAAARPSASPRARIRCRRARWRVEWPSVSARTDSPATTESASMSGSVPDLPPDYRLIIDYSAPLAASVQ
ncbi:hypothetical protein PFISCL1PPCAC_8191, partial [Pristionchus fissidentatus]